ncbi:MAG: sodium:solute symporter [Phocaeicola sp.]
MHSIYILLTIASYFALLLLIARLTGKQQSNDAFFRGSRTSPWYIVSFGMIGTSLSGISFVSVPGMVRTIDMSYMQTCMGFFVGYLVIARLLLPLYYRLNLTSIYSYLGSRIGPSAYKTGSSFFLLSKLLGSAVRLYLVCLIVHNHVLHTLQIPFAITVVVTVLLIWLYTQRSGIRTIIWTDSLQTLSLLLALLLLIYQVIQQLDLTPVTAWQTIAQSPYSRIFVWEDWHTTQHFVKQFFSGVFLTIVMTGLDQDMMQKNLSCRNLREAQKNMYCYGISFIPVNFLFLSLGILLLSLGSKLQLTLPTAGDELLPFFATQGSLGFGVLILFTLGIIAAAFSSADSALTALTTTTCIDFLQVEQLPPSVAIKRRKQVHFLFALLFIAAILLFKAADGSSLINILFTLVSYTYGPLLGLFAFGLFTSLQPRDRYIPWIAVASPLLCYGLDLLLLAIWDYKIGYEVLLLNGMLTFIGLSCLSINKKK